MTDLIVDREPKLAWSTLPLDHETVAAHLAEAMAERAGGSVMIDRDSRVGRHHLKLRRDGGGHFVLVGRKGRDKRYLGRCKVTYFDGEATLFAFTFAITDAFWADQERRWANREARA